jgi:hypothetical protein
MQALGQDQSPVKHCSEEFHTQHPASLRSESGGKVDDVITSSSAVSSSTIITALLDPTTMCPFSGGHISEGPHQTCIQSISVCFSCLEKLQMTYISILN